MPHRFVRQIEPIVSHGIREVAQGVSIDHALRQVALMAALVGAGVPPAQAITTVEQREAELVGIPPGEIGQFMFPRPGAFMRPDSYTPWSWGSAPGMAGWDRWWGMAGWDRWPGMASWDRCPGPGAWQWNWAPMPMAAPWHWAKQHT